MNTAMMIGSAYIVVAIGAIGFCVRYGRDHGHTIQESPLPVVAGFLWPVTVVAWCGWWLAGKFNKPA